MYSSVLKAEQLMWTSCIDLCVQGKSAGDDLHWVNKIFSQLIPSLIFIKGQ